MLEPKTKVIDSLSYAVTPLGAIKGRDVFARLVRLVGPGFARLGEGGKDIGAALGSVVQAISAEEFAYFCDVFAPQTRVTLPSGKSPLLSDIFDLHFSANYLTMVKWLIFCLEVNFGGFLAEIAPALAAKGQVAA